MLSRLPAFIASTVMNSAPLWKIILGRVNEWRFASERLQMHVWFVLPSEVTTVIQ